MILVLAMAVTVAISQSLTDDGRIGKVNEAQGIVVLRPMLAKRWTPICRETLLRPGDWVRTELRGANAVKVTLSSDVVLTLGPGTLLECISANEARLHTGMLQAVSPKQETANDKLKFTLLAARNAKRIVKPGDKLLLRIDSKELLVDVAQTPAWLAGFEGTSNKESLGSLIVNLPDGRNEPLTVGYHKVSVEIRDQIARTTIEQSFVNHTASRLEGVFHFPLPPDASISGFGMWIGNDLIEADVVEKQRAREIYETILREKRDPALLEWTGGNIFKARVFPIEASSEKRIKIVYTQVLPLRANRYRYSYCLRSELLRTTPLRDLSLKVTVNSELSLKSVHCPTHTTRTQQTAHSAQVEFAAQEYSPTRDFEVVCEVDSRQADVVVVPHRRGEDGYFLIQLTPPASDGNWQRDVLPDGKPLNVVLLCDTSASMDSEKRKQQSDFVSAILASLSSDDRFLLGGTDVATIWASPEPMAVNAANIAAATKFLADRTSLGWTNLDRAFEEALAKAPANSHVIYVGDGIVSAGNTDPAAFVKRLSVLFGKSISAESRRTLHAVTVGNSNESVVLKGIANVGGGSVRAITGEQTAQTTALELLTEIAQPGLRDLNIEFRGLKVAAVYPERLPNIAAGTQQILVGRYLPEGKDQQGEIVITGKRGSDVVRYAAKLNLKDAEQGNSFIPRLWARAHLDLLLSQGASQTIQDDIIRLSEEFHIITPYTSLLVLETDADRERFGVQRRFEMRDGERFFADGRNNANFKLMQQQMKRAGEWRIGMRRQILREFAELGRNSSDFQNEVHGLGNTQATGLFSLSGLGGLVFGGANSGGGFGGGGGGRGGDVVKNRGDRSNGSNGLEMDSFGMDVNRDVGRMAWAMDEDSDGIPKSKWLPIDNEAQYEFSLGAMERNEMSAWVPVRSRLFDEKRKGNLSDSAFQSENLQFSKIARLDRYNYGPDYNFWVSSLFPTLEPKPKPTTEPQRTTSDPETWTSEAIAIANSLLRVDSLQALDGGIEVRRDTEYLDPRWNRSVQRHVDLAMYSSTAWLTLGMNWQDQTLLNYCDAKERSVYSLALRLGQSRASVASELKPSVLRLTDSSLTSLHADYLNWNATLERAGDAQVRIVLKQKDSLNVVQFTIDTARHVLLKHEVFNDGKPLSATSFEDFIQLAGSWWARKTVQTDAQGKTTSETRLDVRVLSKDQYTQRLNEFMTDKPSVQFVHAPRESLKVARQKAVDGSASFTDRLVLILHNAELQQWEEMWKHVEAAESLAADKPGVRWIRTVLLATVRRNEKARQRLIQEVQELIPKARQDEVFLAEFILGHANTTSETAEFRAIHQLLKPVYTRPISERVPSLPNRRQANDPLEIRMLESMSRQLEDIWIEREASCLERLGMHEETLAARRQIAEAAPWNADAQQTYAQRLANAGEFATGIAWLQKELARPERTSLEDDMMRTAGADLLRQQRRWDELLKWTTEWTAKNPESESYYTAYSSHLSAMIFNDQLDQAYALADRWLQEAQTDGKMTVLQRKKLDAALNFANGQLPNLAFQRMNERWFEPLSKAARFFISRSHHSDVVGRCVSNHHFIESDVADRLRGDWLTLLRKEVDNLSPSTIHGILNRTLSGRMELPEPLEGRKQLDASEVPITVWEGIAKSLKLRWANERNRNAKNVLGNAIVTLYSSRFRASLLLPFLREQMEVAHPDDKLQFTSQLFENLLSAPWSDSLEAESISILPQISKSPSSSEQLSQVLLAMHRLVDTMLANRIASGERLFNDQGGSTSLLGKTWAKRKRRFGRMPALGWRFDLRIVRIKRTGHLPLGCEWKKSGSKYSLSRISPRLRRYAGRSWGMPPPKSTRPRTSVPDRRSLSSCSLDFSSDERCKRSCIWPFAPRLSPKASIASSSTLSLE